MREKTRTPKPTVRVMNCRGERGALIILSVQSGVIAWGWEPGHWNSGAGSKHQILNNHRQHLPSLETYSLHILKEKQSTSVLACLVLLRF